MIRPHLPVLIPLVFFGGALLIPLLGPGRRSWGAAMGATALAAGLSWWGLWVVREQGPLIYQVGGWAPPMGILLHLDALSAFVIAVICTVAAVVLFHGRLVTPIELPGKSVPYYSSAMMLMGGLAGITVTGDLFNLYVFLEVSSLASYALVSIGHRAAPVAAFRYLILGTVGASFYLLGVGFLYFATGTLNMADVRQILPHLGMTPDVVVAVILMVMGIGLKMGLFPMHTWLPDAYTYAASTSTALIAPIGTKVAAYVLIRLLVDVLQPALEGLDLPVLEVVGYLGAAGIIWGSIMAIAQQDLKRMLAYSSVSQVGYIALGLGLATPFGLIGAVLHILNHACMKSCLFLVAANVQTRFGHTRIPGFNFAVKERMPWTIAAFAIAALSMIGLPPTAGFFSKWYLAVGSVQEGNFLFLAVILISSLLNAVYFFRVLENLYLRPAKEQADLPVEREAPASMVLPVVALGVSLIILGLANAWIVRQFIAPIVPNHF